MRRIKWFVLLLLMLFVLGCTACLSENTTMDDTATPRLSIAATLATPTPSPVQTPNLEITNLLSQQLALGVPDDNPLTSRAIYQLNTLAAYIANAEIRCFASAKDITEAERLRLLHMLLLEQKAYDPLLARTITRPRHSSSWRQEQLEDGEYYLDVDYDFWYFFNNALGIDAPVIPVVTSPGDAPVFTLSNDDYAPIYACIDQPIVPTWLLSAYEPLGEGQYYVAFDRYTLENNIEVQQPDALLLLVEQKDNWYGFKATAMLRQGDDGLLPDDFPVPNIPVPLPSVQDYESDPLDFLYTRIEDKTIAQQELSEDEILALNDMAYPVFYLPTYFHSEALQPEWCMQALQMYYYFQDETRYPFDLRVEGEHGFMTNYLTPETASKMSEDLLGVSVQEYWESYDPAELDQWDSSSPYLENGMIRFPEHDTYDCRVYLTHYQYLGDDLFYLAFKASDDNLPGPESSHYGITYDQRRLLVKRSQSEWGFTICAILSMAGEEPLLPPDFPLPSEKVPAPLNWFEEAIEQEPLSDDLSAEDIEALNQALNMLQVSAFLPKNSQSISYNAITALQSYYQYHSAFDLPIDQMQKTLHYPPEGKYVTERGKLMLTVSPEVVKRFAKDWFDVSDTFKLCEYRNDDYRGIFYRDGLLYIGRWENTFSFSVSRYQYMGEGIYYLSCDVDLAGYGDWDSPYSENSDWGGIYPDSYKVLVRRADTDGGFSIIAVFQEGHYSLIPGIPLPAFEV